MKNTIDTIRNQVKSKGFTASTQQIKDQAFLLKINLETATTQEKIMISDAIVKSNNVQGNQSTLVKSEINLQDVEKHEIIQRQATKLQINLTASEVTEISKNISDSFKSKQSLTRQVVVAIKKYVEYQADLDALCIAETAQEIIEIQNRSNSQSVQKLQEISSALKDNTEEWQTVANDVLEMFKV